MWSQIKTYLLQKHCAETMVFAKHSSSITRKDSDSSEPSS